MQTNVQRRTPTVVIAAADSIREANQRLSDAAPDMARALVGLILASDTPDAWKAARAALRKAGITFQL